MQDIPSPCAAHSSPRWYSVTVEWERAGGRRPREGGHVRVQIPATSPKTTCSREFEPRRQLQFFFVKKSKDGDSKKVHTRGTPYYRAYSLSQHKECSGIDTEILKSSVSTLNTSTGCLRVRSHLVVDTKRVINNGTHPQLSRSKVQGHIPRLTALSGAQPTVRSTNNNYTNYCKINTIVLTPGTVVVVGGRSYE